MVGLKHINGFLNEIAFNNGFVKNIGKPTIFTIETTNKCNLACVMCPRQFMTRKAVSMEMGLFKKIIDQVKHNQSSILLHGMGEPFLDDKIIERINYCSDNGVHPYISSNATFLDEKNSRALLSSKVSGITLSLDGATAETYSKIRVKGDFEKVRANVHRFMKIKREEYPKSKARVTIQFIKMNSNIHEVKAFKDEWEAEKPDEVLIKPFSTFGGQYEEISNLSDSGMRYQPNAPLSRPPCYYLWKSLVVQADGKVVTCCRDYDSKVVIGDLNSESLLEVWNGKKLMEMRKAHLRGDFKNGLCDNCYDTSNMVPKKFYPFNKEFFRHVKSVALK